MREEIPLRPHLVVPHFVLDQFASLSFSHPHLHLYLHATMTVPYKLHSHSLLTPTSLQGAVKHMNKDHTHNLTNIIQAHLNLSRPPTHVTMTAMDFQGFEVTFKRTPSGFWSSKDRAAMMGVRIPWQGGKINDSKEARVQLVALSEKSEAAVGKVSPCGWQQYRYLSYYGSRV